ncbi:MAG: hypothetical protein RIQ89_2373 [Bacteroidota bacterium]|jgi:triosephosphate isomerase
MTRTKYVAGNWKMNLTKPEAVKLFTQVIEEMFRVTHTKVIVAAPFVYLDILNNLINDQGLQLSAQNVATSGFGAFTGEVSAPMLYSLGLKYCIIGHSERRQFFGDTNEVIKSKVDQTIEVGMQPVFCCGETLDQRESGEHFSTVKFQLQSGLFHLSEEAISKVIIAYEPVWAIGTGKTASALQAQEMHQMIRTTVSEKYTSAVASNIAILYGGSVNAGNAKALFQEPDIDGALVGGASLKADEFAKIIHAMEDLFQ